MAFTQSEATERGMGDLDDAVDRFEMRLLLGFLSSGRYSGNAHKNGK